MLGYHGGFMLRPAALVLGALLFNSCKPSEVSHSKAILGAVLLDGSGGPPLSDSVVVVAGGRFRAAGARSTVPIPAESDKINGGGKFIVPAPIDISAAKHLKIVTVSTPEAEIEAARAAGTPVIGTIVSQADVRLLLDRGVSGFIGMIPDSEEPDPALVSRLRDLRIFFAPTLAKSAAPRNTERLFRAGVPLAIASAGGDFQREIELLAEAGVPALDVIVAATRNGARALGHQEQIGVVDVGKRADLLLLSANPGEDVRNLRQVTLRMVEGEWVK